MTIRWVLPSWLAGLDLVTVHTLRHTFKTMVDTGENLGRAAADGASETEHDGVIHEAFAHGPGEGWGEAGLENDRS